MNQTVPSDLAALRDLVREVARSWMADHAAPPSCDSWMRGYDLGFSRELASRGLLGVSWPQRYGGAGLPGTARLVVTEELLRHGAPVAAHWIAERQIGPSILRYGSDELREQFLPAIAHAQVTFCLGMSETEAGSDLAAVRTRAVRSDNGWAITGTKIWTSHAHRATHAYVLARTGDTQGRAGGLTEFIVPMSDDRVSVRPILDMQGEHHFNELVLDGVVVPAGRVIGTVGNGWRQVTEQLSLERGGAERYLSTYPLFAAMVSAISEKPDRAAVERLGSLTARLSALRHLAWSIASGNDAGVSQTMPAARLKYLGTAFEKEVVEAARYVLDVTDAEASAWALLQDGVLAVPAGSIRGGSSEVLLTLLARGAAPS